MRVAIVGCGQISRSHIAALGRLEGKEIVAVGDRDGWKARDAAELAGGAMAFTEMDVLLRESRPQAVHVLTPPDTHASLAVRAMEAGCHVLVEKPMALSVAEADLMIAAAQANGVILGTNHNYLFKPSVDRARRLVRAGAIGQVVYVNSYYGLSGEGNSYAASAGRSHWAHRLPGGAFANFLPHMIYLQLAFLPDFEAVEGVSLAGGGAGDPPTELVAMLRGATASGVISISMRAKPYAKFVDIYCTRGIIHADLVREICTIHREIRIPRMLSKALFSLEESLQLATQTAANSAKVALGKMASMPELPVLLDGFYSSIERGGDPPVTAEDGRRMVAVMESIRDRSPVAAPHPPIRTRGAEAVGPRTAAERVVAGRGLPGRVLVTGGTGFLGHRLIAALSRCGAETVALARDESRVSEELKGQARVLGCDLRDPEALEAAMGGMAVVFHCAAITTNRAPWSAHYETNVLGTEAVLKGALTAGVGRVIHASSVIVYGLDRPRRGAPVKESDPYAGRPDRWAHYMRSKIAADRLALDTGRASGLPVTVLRLGVLYGPGSGRAPIRGLAQLGGLQLLVGDGGNSLPFTYVDNAVDALLLAAVSPQAAGRAYNVVDEPQHTMAQALSIYETVTGEPTRRLPVPSSLLSGLAALMEWRGERTGAALPPPVSRYVVRSACRNITYDTEKARSELGWYPEVGLEEGLRLTIGLTPRGEDLKGNSSKGAAAVPGPAAFIADTAHETEALRW